MVWGRVVLRERHEISTELQLTTPPHTRQESMEPEDMRRASQCCFRKDSYGEEGRSWRDSCVTGNMVSFPMAISHLSIRHRL